MDMELTQIETDFITRTVNDNIKSYNMGFSEGEKSGYQKAMMEMKTLLESTTSEHFPEPEVCASCGGPEGQGNCFACKMD